MGVQNWVKASPMLKRAPLVVVLVVIGYFYNSLAYALDIVKIIIRLQELLLQLKFAI